jgi:PAS domain-containing protein
LDSIDEAVYSFDRAWRLTYLNREAAQLEGQPLEKLIGCPFEKVFPRAVGTFFDRETRRVMADRQFAAFETQNCLPPKWLEVRVYPSTIGITIHARDITKRKQLEDERDRLLAGEKAMRADLEAERSRLQAVLDQMPEQVILFDTRGRIRFFNQAALALSVGETGQVDQYGNPINYDMLLPSGEPLRPTDSPIVRTIERSEVIRDFEVLLRQRDGRRVAVRGSAAPVCGPHGERLGSVAAFQDISALKALEREREE